MDDTVFVWLAEEKLKDPLAMGIPSHGYEGNFFPNYLDTHPPLISSYLALLIRIFGGASEAGLHAGFIIFPLLAAVSMFFLSRRFTDSPLAAALLLIVTPGFMVMAQSVMSDIPTLAFWLAAVTLYIYAVDRGEVRLIVLAGIAVALAVLTTYQSLSLLPLLLLYALLKRRATLKNMVPLASGLAVFGAFIVFFFLTTGGPPKLSYSIGVDMDPVFIARKILSIVSVLGGGVVFPLFLIAGLLKGKRDYLSFTFLAVLLFIVTWSQVATGQYTPISAVLQVVFYSAGIIAVYRFVKMGSEAFTATASEEDRDTIFLVLWISGVLIYCVILLPYASTRYLLPLFPPVILMFIRYARTVLPARDKWVPFAAAAIICTAATGLAVSIADYQLAGVYREFAGDYFGNQDLEGRKVWFAGEFGLRYYLEPQGAEYIIKESSSPAPGDYVILSRQVIAYFISDDLKNHLQLESGVEYPTAWPVRVQDTGSLAGFYGQFHGSLPYSVSSEPVESIGIYIVSE